MLSNKKVEINGVSFFNEAEAKEALKSVWSLLTGIGERKPAKEKLNAAKFCLVGAEQGLFGNRGRIVIKVCKGIITKANKQ